MEAAIPGIGVLLGARLAHREPRHGGGRAVVGQSGGDGEPRAAVRAGDERVPEPAIGRVTELGQAVVADRHVGRDERAARPGTRGADGELGAASERKVRDRQRLDHGQRWWRGFELPAEPLDSRQVAFDLRDQSGWAVPHLACEAVGLRQGVDVRPEAHALDHAADLDAASGPGSRGGRALCGWSHGIPVRCLAVRRSGDGANAGPTGSRAAGVGNRSRSFRESTSPGLSAPPSSAAEPPANVPAAGDHVLWLVRRRSGVLDVWLRAVVCWLSWAWLCSPPWVQDVATVRPG